MMGEIKSFRDLVVWQKSVGLVVEVYAVTGQFPKEEIYGLTSQMRRCAVSVPSNIAEGYGRNTTSDYIRFLRMAIGSLFELMTQIVIAVKLDFATEEDLRKIEIAGDEIEKMLISLSRKLDVRRQEAGVNGEVRPLVEGFYFNFEEFEIYMN